MQTMHRELLTYGLQKSFQTVYTCNMTITVEVINKRALNLLSDMEHLDLIRVNVPAKPAPASNSNLAHLAGALKLSDKRYEYYQKTLQDGRNEWDRDIF
jgi:hypothetical protein